MFSQARVKKGWRGISFRETESRHQRVDAETIDHGQKEVQRRQIADEIAAYLANGGTITYVDYGVSAIETSETDSEDFDELLRDGLWSE